MPEGVQILAKVLDHKFQDWRSGEGKKTQVTETILRIYMRGNFAYGVARNEVPEGSKGGENVS